MGYRFNGTFLKGKYVGMVLSAMGLDNNIGIFPIAIYICINECKETWKKFLSILAPHVTKDENPITFISDQQKGLIYGVARQFGYVRHHHRFSFRHLYKNMKIKFPGAYLEELVWRAAKSYNEVDFKFWMDQVEELNPDARTWSIPMETLYKREQPGLTRLKPEAITGLVDRGENRLKRHNEHVHFFHPLPSTQTVWFVDPCHFVNKYMETYAGSVQPIANLVYWLEVPDIYKVNPPRIVKPVGMPRSQRRREREMDI